MSALEGKSGLDLLSLSFSASDPQQTSEMRSDSRANAAATAMLATEAKRTTRIVVA
jgi:hypothetical protein